jgi:hypothetical protein
LGEAHDSWNVALAHSRGAFQENVMSKDSRLDTPVWGARDIGKVINKSEKAAFYLLKKGLLPAEKVGESWVSTPRKLLHGIGIKAA